MKPVAGHVPNPQLKLESLRPIRISPECLAGLLVQ